METPPHSMQPLPQFRHVYPALDTLLHYIDLVFVARFKTFAIVKKNLVVLW
jgi:hypothetical protein